MKIKINSNDDLSLEKTLNMCTVVIHFKSVLNAYLSYCTSQVFLAECLNKLAEYIYCCLLELISVSWLVLGKILEKVIFYFLSSSNLKMENCNDEI